MDINNLYDEKKKKIILFELVRDKNQDNDSHVDNMEGNDYMIKHETVNKLMNKSLINLISIIIFSKTCDK